MIKYTFIRMAKKHLRIDVIEGVSFDGGAEIYYVHINIGESGNETCRESIRNKEGVWNITGAVKGYGYSKATEVHLDSLVNLNHLDGV